MESNGMTPERLAEITGREERARGMLDPSTGLQKDEGFVGVAFYHRDVAELLAEVRRLQAQVQNLVLITATSRKVTLETKAERNRALDELSELTAAVLAERERCNAVLKDWADKMEILTLVRIDAEREACAKVAEDFEKRYDGYGVKYIHAANLARGIAGKIRARK